MARSSAARMAGARPAAICAVAVALMTAALAAGLLPDAPVGAAAPGSRRALRPAPEGPAGPWVGDPGITEGVAAIMARSTAGGVASSDTAVTRSATKAPANPQAVGVSFTAIALFDAGVVPPNPSGDVGPGQILVATDGRIRVFDKTGNPGVLDTDLDSFFASVRAFQATSSPQVRYDRLSGRWFVTCITSAFPNRVLIAVSSGSTIDGAAGFTFFYFQQDLVSPAGQTGYHLDDPSLGIDASALYIGGNMLNGSQIFVASSAFVVRKSSLLAGGPIVATAFRSLGNPTTGGMWAPRGVDNDDPSATQGYFIGVDILSFGRLDLRRVANPGGSASISANVAITVPDTAVPIPVLASGVPYELDAIDDRLLAARIHTNAITGARSLFTAHGIKVDATGQGTTGGDRDGARWYELQNLSGTPVVAQTGTLFDPADIDPRSFWIPSVAMSGQGHVAMGASTAGALFYADVAVAGRLASDPPGTLRDFTLATGSTTQYDDGVTYPQSWGKYTATVVDPNDDMTMWTFQEWCNDLNSWGIQVIQLLAPPPAAPISGGSVCGGLASVEVTIGGDDTGGAGFFDPGPDTGGPGYPDRIAAAVTGGVVVNGVTFVSPTQLTLGISTVGAALGLHDVTITNPDGQARTGAGLVNVTPAPPPPAASNNGPLCEGAALQLSAAPGAGTPAGTTTWSWTGPNGFTSTAQNPSIPAAGVAAAGQYSVTVTVNGCASASATTTVTMVADGAACAACGLCQAGACAVADSDSDGVADGCDCAPLDPGAWGVPGEATGLALSQSAPAPGSSTNLAWSAPAAGGAAAAMLYDVIRSSTAADFVDAATCLVTDAGPATAATDPAVPPLGTVYYYVVRAQNVCGAGIARTDSTGTPQPARDCP